MVMVLLVYDYGGGPGFPYNPGQQTGYLGLVTNFQLIPRDPNLMNCIQGETWN